MSKESNHHPPADTSATVSPTLRSFWEIIKSDGPASFVVFLVALPLCMGIAIASGMPVAAGLITGIVGGLIVGVLAGSPLQVSGPAAGLTVIVYQIVEDLGMPILGLVVLLGGVLQFIAGALGIGQWFRAVSPAVIKGMLAGIGVLIFASQFHVMVDDSPKGSGLQNLATIPHAIFKGLSLPSWGPPEEREMLTDKLRNIGELQRRQISLEQSVAELAPAEAQEALHPGTIGTGAAHLRLDADTPRLEQLVNEQQAILTALEESVERFESMPLKFHSPERSERIREAADQALATTRQALATLQSDGANVADAMATQAAAVTAMDQLQAAMKNHNWAGAIGLLTLAVIVLWQSVAPRKLRILPGPLLGVLVATILACVLVLPVLYVAIPDNLFRDLHVVHWSVFVDTPWVAVIQAAFVIAVVASAETLLCAAAVDQLHSGPRTRYNQELAAQGVGNMVCGLLGALPMTGVIVRSSANLQAGARTRWSAVFHGIWLLVFVVGLSTVLRYIPTASLAAILVYTGYKLVDIKAVKQLAKYGKAEVVIYMATLVTIVVWDLLTGVIVGVFLSGIRLLYNFSHLETELQIHSHPKRANLDLAGAATFVSLPKLAAALEQMPKGTHLSIQFQNLDYIDHACLDLLMSWARQHESSGGALSIDWDGMHAKFRERKVNGGLRRHVSQNGQPEPEHVTSADS